MLQQACNNGSELAAAVAALGELRELMASSLGPLGESAVVGLTDMHANMYG